MKKFITLVSVLVLVLAMVGGCGTTEQIDPPNGNTETVAPEITVPENETETPVIDEAQEPENTQPTTEPVIDIVPEEIPTDDTTPTEDIQEPVIDEPIEETPEIEEEELPKGPLEDYRAETLNYEFEGIYWMTEYGAVVYYDGTNEYYYYDDNYDGLAEESKREYTATENTYEYVGATYGFRWYIYEDTFGFWLDGGEMGGDAGAMETTYTAISKEKAIELYPVIGEDKDETETPQSTPVATDSLEAYRVETLNYDFEGIYWLYEDGDVTYFDGESETIYSSDGSVKVYALSETNDEYFVYDDGGFALIWYINGGRLYFCLGDYSVYNTLTPLTKEQAIEKCPAINGVVGEDKTQNESAEATVGDFEGKYWVDSYGMSCRYYDNGEEVIWYSDGDTRNDNYVVNGDTIAFGEYEYKFWIENGKLYMEPMFSDGFGGETMAYTEITKDELDAFLENAE